MNEIAISSLSSQMRGILRYEALQEIKRDILIETPFVKVEVRSMDFQDPVIKALVERIKYAKLPWQKKEHLLRLVFTYLRAGETSSTSAPSQDDFIKEMYNLVQVMELTERYHIKPEELNEHKKKADRLVADFLTEEERNRQLKENQQKSPYTVASRPEIVTHPFDSQGQSSIPEVPAGSYPVL